MSISAETQIIPVEGDDGKSYILYTIEVELFATLLVSDGLSSVDIPNSILSSPA